MAAAAAAVLARRAEIDPWHPALSVWYAVVLLASAFAVAYAPFVVALGNFWAGGALVVLDLVFGASLWVNDHTGFLRADGVVVGAGAGDVAVGYRASAVFTDDLLCAIPIETIRAIWTASGPGPPIGNCACSSAPQFVMMFGVLRALAFNDRLDAFQRRSTLGPLFFKHVRLVSFTILLIHWLGAAISVIWKYRSIPDLDAFTEALYWAASTVIPVGYGNINVVRSYVAFLASVIMFAATVCFLYVILQIADDEFRLSRVGGALSRNLQRIADYFRSRAFPADLRLAILSYLQACLPTLRSRSFRYVELLRDLPVGLRRQVATQIYEALLLQDWPAPEGGGVVFDTDRVAQLVLDQRPQSYLPGTVLLRPAPPSPLVIGVVVHGVVEATDQVTGRSCLLTAGALFHGPDAAGVLLRTLTFAKLHLVDHDHCVQSLRHWRNLHGALAGAMRRRMSAAASAADGEADLLLAGSALHDARFEAFGQRKAVTDDLAPILSVTSGMGRDDLESVLVMVESLVRRKQIRDQFAGAVRDLVVKREDGPAT